MNELKVLDGFCGGGGAAMGMIAAGASVVGIDKNPHCAGYYPGAFHKGNVLQLESWRDLLGKRFVDQFDLIWMSPPCQHYSQMTLVRGRAADHPDLIDRVRDMLIRVGKPYIIENVGGARDKLREPIELCGLMFGLKLYRHRYFECSFPVRQPEHPVHAGQQLFSVVGNPVGSRTRGIVYREVIAAWPDAMGIYHIPPGSRHFAEAIPPAFSEYLVNEFKRYKEGQ